VYQLSSPQRRRLFQETKRPAKQLRFFHGTETKESLFNILSNGLQPHSWGFRSNPKSSKDGSTVFLARNVPLALFYGSYIVEVLVNLNDHDLVVDDDSTPIGEIPERISEINEFFRDFMPFVSVADQRKFKILASKTKQKYGYIDHNNNSIRAAMRYLAYKYRKQMQVERGALSSNKTMGQQLNIGLKRPIGLKGRTRIIGAYEFKSIRHRVMQCVNIYYNQGGSVDLGDEFKPSADWMQ